MKKAFVFIVAASAGWAVTAPSHADTLDDIVKAMGADKLKTVEFIGTGYYFHFGGSNLSSEPWPKFNLKPYLQRVDYGVPSMGLDLILTQALFPPRGAGGQPIRKTHARYWYLNGDIGWGISRSGKPQEARSTTRSHHALWTTPHGVVKALQAAKAEIKMRKTGGKTYKTATFGKKGAFTATAWFDKNNILRGVDSRISNFLMGDMPSRTLYGDYKDIGGIKFPMRIQVTYGDHPGFDIKLTEVKPNAPVDVTVPKKILKQKYAVKSEKIANGVWYLRGGSHHSVVIEMADHVIVYEGPLNNTRGQAVLDAARKLVSGKPIRYVINSHHHYDHSGGLRPFVADGITIVTHETNKGFYQKALSYPARIRPDRLSKSGKKAKFLTVTDRHTFSDSRQTIELYTLKGSPHSETNMIAYLPKHKVLIVADAYSARRIYDKPVKKDRVNPTSIHLWNTLADLKLDIETVLPIHGKKVGLQQIRFAAGLE
ncbi:MAG: MBL fold metallo-hydrolase [Rhodospirillales bacterium]